MISLWDYRSDPDRWEWLHLPQLLVQGQQPLEQHYVVSHFVAMLSLDLSFSPKQLHSSSVHLLEQQQHSDAPQEEMGFQERRPRKLLDLNSSRG